MLDYSDDDKGRAKASDEIEIRKFSPPSYASSKLNEQFKMSPAAF